MQNNNTKSLFILRIQDGDRRVLSEEWTLLYAGPYAHTHIKVALERRGQCQRIYFKTSFHPLKKTDNTL